MATPHREVVSSNHQVTSRTRAASYVPTAALDDRDALIEAHLPLVRFISDRLAARLPSFVDRDDLISAGVLGLLDAVEKYDARRGVLFKTYAELRVRGAMLDSLRNLDWAPRSARRRQREVEAAYHELEQRLGRPAREEEIAAHLKLSMPEFYALLNDLRGLNITNLDDEDDSDTSFAAPQLVDSPSRNPLAIYELAERREHLAAAINCLPERERQVVALYYLEELSMKEIGAVLGITESRVSQLHTGAVLRLRATLGAEMRNAASRANN